MSVFMDSMTHTYLTDDRDLKRRPLLEVTHGPNGDFYIAVMLEGKKSPFAVRFSTSGGCASENPLLLKAVRGMFQALGGWGEPNQSGPYKRDLGFIRFNCPLGVALGLDPVRCSEIETELANLTNQNLSIPEVIETINERGTLNDAEWTTVLFMLGQLSVYTP